jgi:ATP-binding cassette subfamily C (CFTR/MRP) protein 1
MASWIANGSIADPARCLINASYDNLFGPAVHNCQSDFDFTLLFEQSILLIVPSALLLLYLPFRIWQIWSQELKAHYHGITLIKQVNTFFIK